jgi:hypothetical protein
MNFSSISAASLSSLKQALNISVLQKSMNQDALSVSSLLQGMKDANAKVMEQSVTPHKGKSIDVRV